MNTNLTTRSICAIALGGWAAVASALTIGPLAGMAVLGRPLELVAPIQFDELSRGNGSGCVTTEVRYGDRIVAGARVDVDQATGLSSARITSATPVDEPFVTVLLNAGCRQSSSRRFVLLAEAPRQEPMALAAAPTLAVAMPAEPVAATRLAGARSRVDRAPAARRVVIAPREPATSGGRLQLAVWDPNAERLPWLRASAQLVAAPAEDDARRAAATALWRALNAQPQDLLRTAERLSGLEGEVRSLRSLSAQHRAEIESARESLQSAQGKRHTNLLLVTLLALLAGSTGAVLWNHRTRRPAPNVADSWYGVLEPWEEAEGVVAKHPPPPAIRSTPQAGIPPGVKPPTLQPTAPARATPAPPAFTPTEPAPPSATLVAESDQPGLKVDALQAAQQQSEFFASLGQIDEAVAVLTSYLEESLERPVLAFLELLRIYHGTGMRAQYEELQSTFRRIFGMDVASFSQFSDEPRELDLYLMPVTRIAAAWPSQDSQDIIEELLFKHPATPRDLLSLQAYRDLLWLYALGHEIVHSTSAPAGLQLLGDLPWAVGEPEQPPELSVDRLDTIDGAPELTAFGVDIDLTSMRSETHAEAEAEAEAKLEQPEPTPAPVPGTAPGAQSDAFDAAMGSESRRR